MRSGERDGTDYHFVSREQFDQMVAEGAFAEWAEVHGNRYGTARSTLQRASEEGRDVLLDIDVQGAAQLRASGLAGVFIFILPPGMAELRQRLDRSQHGQRGGDRTTHGECRQRDPRGRRFRLYRGQ